MANERPRDIRIFEVVQLVSLAMVSINMLAPWTGPAHDWGGAITSVVLNVVLTLVLTLAATRWRQQWARWAFVLLAVASAALLVSQIRGLLSSGYPGWISLGLGVIQDLAIVLLFTRQASNWLRRAPPVAETFG